jgi:hypothetical protein
MEGNTDDVLMWYFARFVRGSRDERGQGLCLEVYFDGPVDHSRQVVDKILEVLQRSEAEWLANFAATNNVKISQSLSGYVVIIREGVAWRTELPVTPQIKEALGDNLLTNQQGRKEATQWLSCEIATSPLSTSEEIADGNPTS